MPKPRLLVLPVLLELTQSSYAPCFMSATSIRVIRSMSMISGTL